MEQPLLALTLHSMDNNSIDVSDLWTVFTRCKDSIQHGRRLENMSWRLWYRQTTRASLSQKSLETTTTPQISSQPVVEEPPSPVASFKEIISTFGSSDDQLIPARYTLSKSKSQVKKSVEQTTTTTTPTSFSDADARRNTGKFFIPSDSEDSDDEEVPVYRARHRRRKAERSESPKTSDWDSDYRCSGSSSSSTYSTPGSPCDLPEPTGNYFAKRTQHQPTPQKSLLSSMLATNPNPEPPKFLRRTRAPVYHDLNQLADRHQEPCLSESLKRNLIRENSTSGRPYKLQRDQPRVVDPSVMAMGWSDLAF
ncbi:hypothetical protein NQZ79_g5204 [Umbelopsis isabellina]|nr:hypothetical protein NQZ79_g5204 [Umbelopsis isabellina]